MILMSAPLQGFTEAPWRHWHAEIYGGADRYFTPFMRLEHGQVRPRDVRDTTSPLNSNHCLTPQVLAADAAEFTALAEGLQAVDLNAGCPFPPQTRRGRGAALLTRPEAMWQIAEAMRQMPSVSFSLKMRLGMTSPQQWRQCADAINSMPLTLVTVHPRTAAQQYGGDTCAEEFELMHSLLRHPLVWNGDVTTPAQITALQQRWPWLHGVMCGRGLLSRPSLFMEWRHGRELPEAERRQMLLRLHDAMFSHMQASLCGDTQVLSKIKPWWEHWQDTVGRKAAKALLKAGSMARYRAALAAINP